AHLDGRRIVVLVGDVHVGRIEAGPRGVGALGRSGGDGVIDVAIDVVVVHAGDGDRLRGAPGVGGEGQRLRIDRALAGVVAGQADGHVRLRPGLQDHGEGGRAARLR